jgi:NAD+ dependent glucose-6-phosphate dehydrogenase
MSAAARSTTVAVTGGQGLVATVLRDRIGDRFDFRWLSHGEADITDLSALERAFAGAHSVIHLAATADVAAGWDDVLAANVIGARNVYEAARRAGVELVVFASSNHAVGMYMWDDDRFADPDHPDLVGTDVPVRPDSLYGASKVWGEALGRLYSERLGLRVICLRIGWVTEDDKLSEDTAARQEPAKVARRAPGMWMSHRDCASLFEAALRSDASFGIVNGVSDNRGRWFSLDEGRRLLGWEPVDGR